MKTITTESEYLQYISNDFEKIDSLKKNICTSLDKIISKIDFNLLEEVKEKLLTVSNNNIELINKLLDKINLMHNYYKRNEDIILIATEYNINEFNTIQEAKEYSNTLNTEYVIINIIRNKG